MLNKTIKFSLNNKLFVLLAGLALMVVGIFTANEMDVDVFPDLTAPTVVVMTDAHGTAAEEVERLITFPIEAVMNGATDVRRVRSSTSTGYSFVWVEFDWGTDIFKARQIVSEKMVTLTSDMPEGIEPILAPQSSVMGEILFIGLQSDSTSLMELRTLAEWRLKPAILSTGGVSQVTIIGGDLKQYQVLANPQKMNIYGVSLDEIATTCESLGSNSSGNVLRQYGNEYAVRGMARTPDIALLKKSLVSWHKGKAILLEDVADVRIGAGLKMGHASQNASPSIILSISKQPNINTLRVTEKIEANLNSIAKTFPADIKMNTHIFRQADFIETAVNNVQRSLIEGAIFVLVILLLFLGSIRTTLISIIAIPLSLLGTIIVLHLFNMNINTMSLGGMAIAIGSLVDDAIIDVENVYKRLKQNHLKTKEERKSALFIVYDASTEIRASILNATIIIMVAFIPLFFLSGMEGRMLKPLGVAYIVSLFMSLIVAMTITPLLCKLLLSNDKYLDKKQKDSRLTSTLAKHYSTSLKWALRHKRMVVGSAVFLFLLSLFVFSQMGRTFLPGFNEGSLTISAITKPGVSLEQSNLIGNLIEQELLSIPEITSTARRTGRGELDEHSQATNSAEIDVNFSLADRDNSDFIADVRTALAGLPGIATTVGQPLGHRIDHMLSGTRANIAIKVFGNDLQELYRLGKTIENNIAGIEGLVDLNVEQQTTIPQIQIKPNRLMLANHGITISAFNRFINHAFGGEKMTEIYEGQSSFDLVLRLNDDHTQTVEGMRSALIDTHDGRKVPLERVADIVSATGSNAISRENVQRKLVVSANVSERDLRSVVRDIRTKISNSVILPEGYRIEYGGQFESEARASRILLLTSILAICIIFLLLYQEFKNMALAGIILLNLPLALIGGVFAVYFTSGVISIPAIIGFITLFGIATRNGILLISKFQHLQNAATPIEEAVILGSADRLNPILMTALTAALALVPLAVNGNLSGNEIQSPMAKVILGGLLTSTLLNIYVVPIIYSLFIKRVLLKNESKTTA